MNVAKFVRLLDDDKVTALEKSLDCVKTYCSLCGKIVNGGAYCFGCGCFVCLECDDDTKKHICAGAG